MSKFVHLHLHSDFSLLDGLGKIDAYMKRANDFGMGAVALTDHGALYGAINFYEAAHKAGVKPIVGCEMYVAPRGMRSREGRVDQEQIYHLVLLAKNAVGYQNLIKLVSRAHIEGFYYKPRVDHALLREYSEGIVCLSACLAAEVPRALLAENYDEAKRVASFYREIYGEGNYFLELQDHPAIPEQKLVNEGVIQLSKDLSLPLVCTSDVHYVNRDDMAIQDVLICVQTGKTLDDPKRLKMTSDTNFFRSPDEMAQLFKHVPEAVSNTALIADMCELEIKTGTWVLPHYPVPQGQTTEEHLREKVLEGLRKRRAAGLLGIGIDGTPPEFHSPGSTDLPPEYVERVDYELGIINQKGYPAYFLIVQDFANWAREQGIVITTRGSAAGSLVSYGLGIVSVDPLVYKLPFERFLNPFRPSPPDIDMDFEDSRREEVIEYVTRKYGEDKVAQIITFGAMEAKAAIRDVGRVMGLSYGEVDRIAKLIPATVPPTPIERALELVPDLRKLRDSDSQVAKLIDTARRLEGVTRNAGTHAAGVIITEQPLTTYAPVQKDIGGGNKNLIQFDMRNAETIGLMKMDFLGLANLSVLGRAIKILKEYRDFEIDLDRIPLTDTKTYELLSTGETTGLFQVESGGMRRYLRDLKPSTILDIAAMIALYRPGPMPFIPVYIERKHDPSKVEFLHPSLEPILKDSFGVLVYQDDILFISIQIAGYDWEKADKLRKAVGKKDLEVLQAEEEKFVKGCQSHGGLTKQDAQKIWEWMLPFARYGFNKCGHGQTKIVLPDGRRMTLAAAYREQPGEIMAMWPDGEIRPHRVQRIVQTGRKALLKVTTRSGRTIRATPEHRLLTTEGYKQIDEMAVGAELMVAPRPVTQTMRDARRENMIRLNRSDEQRVKASVRMRQWQAGRPPEEKAAHMHRVHAMHPEMTRNAVAAMHERVKWLWANDPEWRQRQMEVSLTSVRAAYDTGPGYGRCSIASNGMWCASQPERDMCEWLIAQGIDFQMHKVLPNGRVCDFYFAGVYWEMDGMDRSSLYFADKYGELPYVVVTPEDFKFVVEHHLSLAHAQNGDPIVAIEPCGEAMTYDVEMAPDGPLNFIANGIVSHNSHAAAYAQITYQTAYLKANYPAEYMAAFLSTAMGDSDKVVKGVIEVKRMQAEGTPITILPPALNQSRRDFSIETVRGEDGVERQAIRFGLAAVKNVGVGAIDAIIAERGRQPDGRFASLDALCAAVDSKVLNKRLLESLVKAGALDEFGARAELFDLIDNAMTAGQSAQRAREAGQTSLFGLFDAPVVAAVKPKARGPVAEVPRKTILAWEKEVTGLYFSEHPLSLISVGGGVTPLGEITDELEGRKVTVVAMISSIRRVITKRTQAMMGIVMLEDMTGTLELVAFPECYERCNAILTEDAIIRVVAKVEVRGDEVQLVCETAELFVQAEESPEDEALPTLHLILSPSGDYWRDVEQLNQLNETLRVFDGEEPVILHVMEGDNRRSFRVKGRGVTFGPELAAALTERLGPAAFRQELPAGMPGLPEDDEDERLSAD
jgi:DNA polymerase III subunit alpha